MRYLNLVLFPQQTQAMQERKKGFAEISIIQDNSKNVTALDLLKKIDLRILINQKTKKKKNQRTFGKHSECGNIWLFSVTLVLLFRLRPRRSERHRK